MKFEFHVSPDGNDGFDGSASKPFRTIRQAVLAASGLLPATDGSRETTVFIHSGIYMLSDSVKIGPSAAGSGERSLTLASCDGPVRVMGGPILRNVKKLEIEEIKDRLYPEARDKVWQCDLASNGIDDPGSLKSVGFSRDDAVAHMELFCDGIPMTLARYPDEDRYLKISGAPTGNLEDGFNYDDKRPMNWKKDGDIRVFGYWGYDWANSTERIDVFDSDNGFIKTMPPYGNYSFKTGQRFNFYNVLEELDAPGEFYTDYKRGLVYFYPDGDPQAVEISASRMEEPLFTLTDAKNVRIEGIGFECCRSNALEAHGCSGLTIDSCVFRDIGQWAIRIEGGKDHAINGCDISHAGDGGIYADAGDRFKLESGNVRITNNDIHHFARISRCYRAGIQVFGVGTLISHNLIHDCPHTAIFYGGNDIRIEFNEIHSACMETGDCGAIYSGRDFSLMGIEVDNNYIHHMGGIGDGSSGVYSDDCLSFTKIRNNFFFHTTISVNSNGGYKILVENNVFSNCFPAVNMSATGIHPSDNIRNMMDVTMKDTLYEKKPLQPPWSERYPELLEIDAFYKAGPTAMVPALIYFLRNILVDSTFLKKHWTVKDDMMVEEGTYKGADPGFEDIEFSDLQVSPDSPAVALGHKPADFGSIGIAPGKRASPAVKAYTSLKIISADEGSGTATLRLSLKNKGNGTVRAALHIYDMINVVRGGPWQISVEPSGIKSVDFMVKYEQGLVLEARSKISGVRPSRLTL